MPKVLRTWPWKGLGLDLNLCKLTKHTGPNRCGQIWCQKGNVGGCGWANKVKKNCWRSSLRTSRPPIQKGREGYWTWPHQAKHIGSNTPNSLRERFCSAPLFPQTKKQMSLCITRASKKGKATSSVLRLAPWKNFSSHLRCIENIDIEDCTVATKVAEKKVRLRNWERLGFRQRQGGEGNDKLGLPKTKCVETCNHVSLVRIVKKPHSSNAHTFSRIYCNWFVRKGFVVGTAPLKTISEKKGKKGLQNGVKSARWLPSPWGCLTVSVIQPNIGCFNNSKLFPCIC